MICSHKPIGLIDVMPCWDDLLENTMTLRWIRRKRGGFGRLSWKKIRTCHHLPVSTVPSLAGPDMHLIRDPPVPGLTHAHTRTRIGTHSHPCKEPVFLKPCVAADNPNAGMVETPYASQPVRGGLWAKIDNWMHPDERKLMDSEVKRQLWSADDRCFRCGSYKHYSDTCPDNRASSASSASAASAASSSLRK